MLTTKGQCQVSTICTHKSLKQETIYAPQSFCWTSSSCIHRCFSHMDTVNRKAPVSQGHPCIHWPAYKVAEGHTSTPTATLHRPCLNPSHLSHKIVPKPTDPCLPGSHRKCKSILYYRTRLHKIDLHRQVPVVQVRSRSQWPQSLKIILHTWIPLP